MDSISVRLCRLCLETSDNLVNIFSDFQDSTIASVLTQHFWFQIHKNDGLSEYVCHTCWTNTRTFHNFYTKIETNHRDNWFSVNTVAIGTNYFSIKQERSDTPEETALGIDLNLVKYEEPPLEVTDMQISKDGSSDYDEDTGCDQSEYEQTSDDDDQPCTKERKYDTNAVNDTLPHIFVRSRSNTRSSGQCEADKLESEMGEFVSTKCGICSDEFDTFALARKHYQTVHNTSHSTCRGQPADEDISIAIPAKSKSLYEACYKNFCEWLEMSNIETISEKVMLDFFLHKSKIQKATTLWSVYSKLKCTIHLNRNVDIGRFKNLTTFLKRKSAGHVAQKSKILTKSDVNRFIMEADDHEYLMMKVAVIVGIAGACRRQDLTKLSTNDVVDTGNCIQFTETNERKRFVVTDNFIGNSNALNITRKYMSLRNPKISHDRFFIGYRAGKCGSQPVGVNTLGAIPKKVATYLGLEDVEQYTGHCFRRSSKTL